MSDESDQAPGAAGAAGHGLSGLRVVTFESRRAAEMKSLIERHGGECVSAPSMREMPLEAGPEVEELARRLRKGAVDILVLLTGVGARALEKALATQVESTEPTGVLELLSRAAIVVRGPKPTAVVKQWGLPIAAAAPEPNTFREVVAVLEEKFGDLRGRRIAVQEYGIPNERLYEALRARGADVFGVAVYRWAPPEDPRPLAAALGRLAKGELDVAMWTSGNQVYSVFEAAKAQGLSPVALERAFARLVVASVGPVCSEALEAHAVSADLEPQHTKMGQLVKECAERARQILARKRGGARSG